jgi:Luciferase-like monooxygenase
MRHSIRFLTVTMLATPALIAGPHLGLAQEVDIVAVDVKKVGQGYRVSELMGDEVVNDVGEEIGETDDFIGVGVGWMEKEFRALGVDPRRRGATTDATLAFLQTCFAGDEVEANGQPFLFRPRPPRPPIIVGGAPPHAIRRAVRFGQG